MSSGASFFLHNSDHDELRQVVREMSHGRGADLVLDTVGVDSTLSAAVSLVAIEGHVAVIGSGGGTYEFTRGAMPYGSTIAEHSAGGVGDLTELVSIAADAALRVEGEVCALDAGGGAPRSDLEGPHLRPGGGATLSGGRAGAQASATNRWRARCQHARGFGRNLLTFSQVSRLQLSRRRCLFGREPDRHRAVVITADPDNPNSGSAVRLARL